MIPDDRVTSPSTTVRRTAQLGSRNLLRSQKSDKTGGPLSTRGETRERLIISRDSMNKPFQDSNDFSSGFDTEITATEMKPSKMIHVDDIDHF